jgi:hypothetical protein
MKFVRLYSTTDTQPAVFTPLIAKLSPADPLGSATSSQGICGYVSVLAALKVTYFLIKGIMLCSNNRGNCLVGDMLI